MIPRIWDQFSEQSRHYLVMDLVPGRDLKEELAARGGFLPEEEVLDIGLALCGVLSYLHEHQPPVVFRDLKPANTMRTQHGALFLIDFGIARGLHAVGGGGTLRPGTMIGTPGYAPLEQYQGMAEPRSDVYALGATLHALLTGYDPEQGQPLTFPPARQLRPEAHAETEYILARAVELKPSDRFADAHAFAQALADAKKVMQALQPTKAATAPVQAPAPAPLSSPPQSPSSTSGRAQQLSPLLPGHLSWATGYSIRYSAWERCCAVS